MERYITYKMGTQRPLVMGIQEALEIKQDGFWGKDTEFHVREWQKNNGKEINGIINAKTLQELLPKMNLKYKILEVIACFEIGMPVYTPKAWGKVTEIDDGAGKNYGVMQHNKFGSLQIMQKKYGFQDPEKFYGSVKGAQAQLEYFENYILNKAIKFAQKYDMMTDREILMVCDSIVQGGSETPTRAPRSWENWNLSPNLKKEIEILYLKYPVKEAFDKALRLTDKPGEIYAELKSRSGVPKWLNDQLSRRRTCYYGTGKVHGVVFDLKLLGFTGEKINQPSSKDQT